MEEKTYNSEKIRQILARPGHQRRRPIDYFLGRGGGHNTLFLVLGIVILRGSMHVVLNAIVVGDGV
jgi:hypothetical protein